MPAIHEANCECCKNEKSKAVEQILGKVRSLIGNTETGTTAKTLDSLRNLNASDFSGGISDIVKIAEVFFATPVESFRVDDLKLDDPNKKIGKFLASEISDVPGQDVSKAVDFSSANFANINSLKVSLSVATIEITKTVPIPFQTVEMKFMINRKGFSYLPVIDAGVKNKEQAIQKLQGVKTMQPVQTTTPLERIQSIASKKYSKSRNVYQAIVSSKTSEELLDKLSKMGIVIFDEIDVGEEVNKMILRASEDAFVKVDNCGLPGLSPAAFNVQEVVEVSKDCCSQEKDSDRDGVPDFRDQENSNPIFLKLGISEDQRKSVVDENGVVIGSSSFDLIEKQLLELDTSYEANDDEILTGLNTFLEDVGKSNSIMQQCAAEKQNALNSYYWFFEAQFLNDIALEYSASRSMMIDSLNGTFATLESERIRSIDLSIELKQQENSVILSAFNRLYPTSNQADVTGNSGPSGSTGTNQNQSGATSGNFALSLAGPGFTANITAEQLISIENDLTFKAEVKEIRKSISLNEDIIDKLSNQIQDQKAFFGLPSFDENEIINFQTFDVLSSESALANKTRVCKDQFRIDSNPISNQVGFTASYVLNLCIHPTILEEAKTIFSLNSPEQGDVQEYILTMTERQGVIDNELWSKYYSPQRVDRLFSYTEQGYTSPKPQFSSGGSPIDPTQQLELRSPTGEVYSENVAQSSLNIGIDETVAIGFWSNLEDRTKNKVDLIAQQVKSSEAYVNYLSQIRAAAENEAKTSFAVNLIYQENSYDTRIFNSYTNSYSVNNTFINSALNVNINTGNIAEAFRNQYRMVYDSLSGFQREINSKMKALQDFIQAKNKCMADQEVAVAENGNSYATKSTGATEGDSLPQDENCKSRLGSDPFGMQGLSDCPGVTKNCYWKEYTKLMQIVSFMPIIDDAATGQLSRRLFRYFPVAIQIPLPTPPTTLPTLASGIPDPVISIPLPIVWKHLITISTPVGIMVMWVTLCGPIPGIYMMYIDEKGQPCFLASPRGPCDIPAKSLKISETDNKSLLEILPVKDTFRVPAKGPFAKLLGGNNRVKTGDPDAKSSVLDKIQEKIKAAGDSLRVSDPWDSADAEKRARANRALKSFPPDQEAVSEALRKIEKVIDDQVGSMNIQGVKFPQNAKKLIKPVIGPAEFVDSFNKLLDSGTSLPSMGLGVKFISLREEMKKFIDRDLSKPETKNKFADINGEIRDMEAGFDDSDDSEQRRKARAAKLRKSLKVPIESVAKEITPTMLGFVSVVSMPIPLPEPCFSKSQLDPIPPYILLLMASIKALPEIIDAMTDEEADSLFSKFLNLDSPLGAVEDSIFFVAQAFLMSVPDAKYPDSDSMSLLKANLKSVAQNFFKIKVRLPHPGAVQITIPSTIIKSAISSTVKGAFAVVAGMIISELAEATNDGDFVKVLAVAAIIKGVFGSDLGNINGNDVKAFIVSSLESVDNSLEAIENMLFDAPEAEYKSIKEKLFPPSAPTNEDAYVEVNTESMLNVATPALQLLQNANIPFPVILQAASQLAGRAIITKVHPFAARDTMPSWEKLSLKNVPFVIWLDQLIATAQKSSGMGSNYVIPYYIPDA